MIMQNKVVACRTPKSKWQIQKRQAGSPLVVLTGCEDGLFRGVYSEHRAVHNEYLNCRHYLLLVAKMWRVSPCVQIKYINYPPKLQRWTIFSQSPPVTTVAKTEYSGILNCGISANQHITHIGGSGGQWSRARAPLPRPLPFSCRRRNSHFPHIPVMNNGQ